MGSPSPLVTSMATLRARSVLLPARLLRQAATVQTIRSTKPGSAVGTSLDVDPCVRLPEGAPPPRPALSHHAAGLLRARFAAMSPSGNTWKALT